VGPLAAALSLLAGPAGAEAPDPPIAVADTTVATEIPRSEPAPPAALGVPAATGLDARLPIGTRRGWRSAPRITDAAIADAIARRGADRSPARATTGFRHRSSDLFRSDHPVEIGEQEMLLRLRLRAKARETMSVELHF
jgi:hypothetical protein